jgi:hypothetical protein
MHQKTLTVIALIATVSGSVAAALLSADFSMSGTPGKCIIRCGPLVFSLILSPYCSVMLIRKCEFPAAGDSITDPETGRQSRHLIPSWRRKAWGQMAFLRTAGSDRAAQVDMVARQIGASCLRGLS